VAALEADRADYRAVLAAVGALAGRVSDAEVKIDAHREAINALGEKVAGFQAEVRERFDTLDRNREEDRGEAAAFRRSVEDGQAELKTSSCKPWIGAAVNNRPPRQGAGLFALHP
jgi:hypothetical protein